MNNFEYTAVSFIPRYFPLILSAYIKDSLLIKDIKMMAYLFSTNVKYAVRFRSTSVRGGFVS